MSKKKAREMQIDAILHGGYSPTDKMLAIGSLVGKWAEEAKAPRSRGWLG